MFFSSTQYCLEVIFSDSEVAASEHNLGYNYLYGQASEVQSARY